MRRFASILLLTVIAALGSGALEYVHNLEHALEDSMEDRAAAVDAGSIGSNQPPHPDHHHDDSNCPTHAQLHMAIEAGIALIGLAFLERSMRVTPDRSAALVSLNSHSCFDCRGPPTAAFC